MPEDLNVTVSPLDLHFVADQVGQLEVLANFIIGAISTAKDFTDLQATIVNELKQVKVTRVVAVDDWLKDQTEGFVVLVRPYPASDDTISDYQLDAWWDSHPVDYWRDEEALPIVFKDEKIAREAIPVTYNIIRIINLAEKHEDKK